MENLPNVSFVTIMHNWENFCILFENTWNTIDYPKDKLEWIIVDTSKKDNWNDSYHYMKIYFI